MPEIQITEPNDNEDYDKNRCIVILKFIRLYWRSLFLVIWPCICLIVFFIDVDRKIRCLYVTVLMMGYFVSECLPLFISGLIPIALIPLLAVNTTADVCANYINNTNFLLLSGLLISHAIHHSGLHFRMAYRAMLIIGCSPRRLLCGLTLTSVVLSMWLVNSATTAMMCPVIHAILAEYEKSGIGPVFHPQDLEKDSEQDKPRPTNITKAFFLTVAYASSVGGTCTLVGAGTNITFKIIFEKYFPDGKEIDFMRWIQYNSVSVILITTGLFFSIQIMLMGLFRNKSTEARFVKEGNLKKDEMNEIIKTKLKDLGPITFHEIAVTIMYCLCVVIWITSKPYLFPGWVDIYPLLLKEREIIRITPVCSAALICFLILTLPSTCTCLKFLTRNKSKRPATISPPLLPWSIFNQKMCWGLLFMIAGGVALADSSSTSGLATYLGNKFSVLEVLPNTLVMIIACGIVSILTEFLTNAACCNIVTPIVIEMTVQMQVHPLLLTYPAAICSAWSFMLPVGNPVNAILVDQANIRSMDMVRYGFAVKMIALTVTFILFPTYGALVYECNEYPDWAKNVTLRNHDN